MTTENILRLGHQTQKPASEGIFSWLIKNQEILILKNTGLRIIHSARRQPSPFTCGNSIPLLTLEGFRNRRYVNSEAIRKNGVLLLTSVSCDIPAFFCGIRNGVPGLTRPPVSIPRSITHTAGTLNIASDGSTLFSSSRHRFIGKFGILKQQLKNVYLLESIITHI